MKRWWSLVLMVVLVILIDPLIHLSLVVSFSVATVALYGAKRSFAWLFVVGLLFDVRNLELLGSSSLMLITLAMVMELFVHRFDQGKSWWVIGFGLLFSLVWHSFRQPPLLLSEAFLETGIAWLVWWLASRAPMSEGVYLKERS